MCQILRLNLASLDRYGFLEPLIHIIKEILPNADKVNTKRIFVTNDLLYKPLMTTDIYRKHGRLTHSVDLVVIKADGWPSGSGNNNLFSE